LPIFGRQRGDYEGAIRFRANAEGFSKFACLSHGRIPSVSTSVLFGTGMAPATVFLLGKKVFENWKNMTH
jgi:hypothetical protein